MKIECGECGELKDVPIQPDDFERWENGEFIQNAAPYLSSDHRELLISGTCGECFERMFADEGCNGICITPEDIGVYGTGVDVAYAHPDCPEHG